MWVVGSMHLNGTFNFICYAFALSKMTVTAQMFFDHPKVTATQK